MPSKDLTPLTSSPIYSFGGASGTRCTRYSLLPVEFHESETSPHFPGFRLFMETESPAGQVDHWISLKIPGTSGGTELPDEFRYRFLCYFYLDNLPEQGLQEAAESLVRMWEYYRVPFVPAPALPPPTTSVVEIGPTYTRPTFYVNEDD